MKKKDNCDGQLSFINENNEVVSEFYQEHDRYVCQSNVFISAKQTLSINAAKLLRGLIMQIQLEDDSFFTYSVSCEQIASFLGISIKRVKSILPNLHEEFMNSRVEFPSPNLDSAYAANLTSICGYDKNKGMKIRLNQDLRPYLIGLRSQYTQIMNEEYQGFSSTYALRLYELICSKITLRLLPEQGVHIDLPIDEIQYALDCNYPDATDFKRKVLDMATTQINRNTVLRVSYERLKVRGSVYDTVRFFINYSYHHQPLLINCEDA